MGQIAIILIVIFSIVSLFIFCIIDFGVSMELSEKTIDFSKVGSKDLLEESLKNFHNNSFKFINIINLSLEDFKTLYTVEIKKDEVIEKENKSIHIGEGHFTFNNTDFLFSFDGYGILIARYWNKIYWRK